MIRSLQYEKKTPLHSVLQILSGFKVVQSRKKERRENSDSFFPKLLET